MSGAAMLCQEAMRFVSQASAAEPVSGPQLDPSGETAQNDYPTEGQTMDEAPPRAGKRPAAAQGGRPKAARTESSEEQFSCAGVIPYDDEGFWLCKVQHGRDKEEVWVDFGGKRKGSETAWATAQREMGEEGGLQLTTYSYGPIYHPESKSQAVFFLAKTAHAPRANEAKVLEVRRFTQLPDDLHPRLKYDKGALLRKALGRLRFRAPQGEAPSVLQPADVQQAPSAPPAPVQQAPIPILELEEEVDPRAAYYLASLTLDQFKALNPRRVNKCTRRGESVEELYGCMRAFLATVLGKGFVRRSYHFAKGKVSGRLFSNGLQNVKREIRGLLLRHLGTDIDMKSAHPTILLWICDTESIPAEHLRAYVADPKTYREEIARCMAIEVDDAKQVVLAMMNDNAPFDPFGLCGFPEWIAALDVEFKAIQQAVLALDKYAHLKPYATAEKVIERRDAHGLPRSVIKRNFEGSFMNLVLCEWENKMINTAREYLSSERGIITMLLSFDGLMACGDHYDDGALLEELSARLQQVYGIDMTFTFKKHDTTFSIPDDFEVYPIREKAFIHNIDPRFFREERDLARMVAGLRGQYEQSDEHARARYAAAAESLALVRGKQSAAAFQQRLWDAPDVGLDADVLKYYSRESNEAKHISKVREELGINTKVEFRESELRDYFLSFWGDNVVTLKKDKNLYVWWRGEWQVDDGSIVAHVMMDMMQKLFANIQAYWSAKLTEALNESDDEEKIKQCKKKLVEISKTQLGYGNTKNTNVKKLVIEQLRAQCKTVDPFDRQLHYFAFTNLVFDLNTTGEFKASKFDFILTTCGKPWIEPTGAQYAKVQSLFESVFPDEEIRKCYLSVLRSALSGVRPEKFVIATGGGRNGKGMINENVVHMLGDYAVCMHLACLTRPIKDGANQELRELHRKRLALASEPEDGMAEKLRLSNIKALTGNDTANARGLYEKETKTELRATLLMECNKLPAITGEKGEAAFERIRIAPFEVTFTNDLEKLAKGPMYQPLDETLKSPEFKEEHRCAFFAYILWGGARELYFPLRTKQLGMQYLQENDDLSVWFLDRYERCEADPPKHFVSIKNMFADFRASSFYIEMKGAEKKLFTETKFQQDIQKNILLQPFYRDAKKVRVQTAKGLKYNTRKGIVHYRLKPSDDGTDDFGDEL